MATVLSKLAPGCQLKTDKFSQQLSRPP